ncbi:MAG: helix-turn-helix transcriptional regulator [Lentisphaeria bacterium]
MGRAINSHLRQVKFIAELRKNSYPSKKDFIKKLKDSEFATKQDLLCSERTLQRDIIHLKNTYNAPIEFDYVNNGYYLTKSWDFPKPVFDEEYLSMTLLGAKLATDILPESLADNMNTAIDHCLVDKKSDFFDMTMINTMLCASGIKKDIDPEIFKELFEAWRQRVQITITYKNSKGEETLHCIEPHIIAFHNGTWYVKGFKADTTEVRLFAVQRILKVVVKNGFHFENNKEILEQTRQNGLFEYEKICDIKLHCDASIAFYIYEQQKKYNSKIEAQEDNSLIVTLNPIVEHEVIRWILGEGGKIKVLAPLWLKEKIITAANDIINSYS